MSISLLETLLYRLGFLGIEVRVQRLERPKRVPKQACKGLHYTTPPRTEIRQEAKS